MRKLGVLLLLIAIAPAKELFNAKVAAIDPFPREVARGKTLEIKGMLKGAYKAPELLIIAPDGRTYKNKDNKIGEFHFTHRIRFENGVGRYRMEIMATKANRAASAARFSVYYGQRRPKVEKQEPLPDGPRTLGTTHVRLLEKRLFNRLNEFRRGIRLDKVAWNEAVAARAREHAQRMARAGKRLQRFGGVGVREMLGRDGAGPGGLSGPDTPWDRVTYRRPFDRPAPQPPGPKVRNHVLAFNVEHWSLEVMFEKYFVREAAFRIGAADPYCLEAAVGAARPPPPKKTKKNGTTARSRGHVYYCVCFVQVNDKTIIAGQNRAYSAVYKAAATRDPLYLRHLGIWGRGGKAIQSLSRVAKDRRPDVSSAAVDGLLLLDEPRARALLDDATQKADKAMRARRWGEAAAAWRPYAEVFYDARIPSAAKRTAERANREAKRELKQILAIEAPEDQAKALKAFARRVKGLPIATEIPAPGN